VRITAIEIKNYRAFKGSPLKLDLAAPLDSLVRQKLRELFGALHVAIPPYGEGVRTVERTRPSGSAPAATGKTGIRIPV
jgi:hypothetical protein